MNLFGKVKRWIRNDGGENTGISLSTVNELFFGLGNAELGPDMSEITYFTCLKTLAEALGKMPLYLMDEKKNRVMRHETVPFISFEPNPLETPIQFFTYLEYCRNHYGNAYVFVMRHRGTLQGLYPLDPRMVQIWVNNTDEFTKRSYYY